MSRVGRGGLRVTVPASAANLGPGFDTFALALGLYDTVELVPAATGLTVEVLDAGAGVVDEVPLDETHLVYRALRHACACLDVDIPGLRLRCENAIPHARGLGSSASAIVAGIVAGYALADREPDASALRMAAEFEGHADNAAASLLGGFVLVWDGEENGPAPYARRLEPHPGIRPVLAVPGQRSSTEATRGLLPGEIPHSDAAFTAGRAALAVHALTGDPELLLAATEDRLHQRYRADAYPASAELVRALRAVGVAAVISGAGPTVLALTTTGSLPETVPTEGFAVRELPVDRRGAVVGAVTGPD